MIKIPINTNGKSRASLSVNLDDVTLAIELAWNERDKNWFANFETSNGKTNNVRMVVGSQLLAVRNDLFKNGDLVVFKTSIGEKSPINYENFGVSYSLYYVNKEDIGILRGYGVL